MQPLIPASQDLSHELQAAALAVNKWIVNPWFDYLFVVGGFLWLVFLSYVRFTGFTGKLQILLLPGWLAEPRMACF